MDNLKKELPEECIAKRLQFEACKQSNSTTLEPNFLHRTKGCRTLMSEYSQCVSNFNRKFMILNNVVADIKGIQRPYSLEDESRFERIYLTKNNFGLDKF